MKLLPLLRAIEGPHKLGSRHACDNLRESELITRPKSSAEKMKKLAPLIPTSYGYGVAKWALTRTTISGRWAPEPIRLSSEHAGRRTRLRFLVENASSRCRYANRGLLSLRATFRRRRGA
jgi:hypothetical protein